MNAKKLFWWALFAAVLLLLAYGVNYVLHNFTGIGPVPTRSAFAGRLPGVQEGNERRFQFFYTTNRENSDETFNGRGNVLSNTLSMGKFDVLISPYMPVEPFVWFDTASMKWGNRSELQPGAFNSELRQAVQHSPQKSLLVIVWGFRDWFQSAALKTAYTAYVLDINTPVVLFDWPGNQGEGFNGYAASQVVATESAPDLARFLAAVAKESGAEKVWVMGSSLGCQTICDSLVWLENQPDLLENKPKLEHVVLSAPDVAADAFNDEFAKSIKNLSRHLTAYVSSNDRALLMSHWLNGQRRLGRTLEIGMPPEDRTSQYEFEEALELLELQAKGARNISIVDATPINSVRNLHHFFTDSPVFFDDLYQRLLQPDDIISRRLHAVHNQTEGMNYWILWND